MSLKKKRVTRKKVEGQKLSQLHQHSMTQMTLHKVVQGGRKCSVDSDRYMCITKQLAIFIGLTNIPISLVENEAFKKLTQVLDSHFNI